MESNKRVSTVVCLARSDVTGRLWRTDDRRAVRAACEKCPCGVSAMCWRQVSKLQKTVSVVIFYFTLYLLFSFGIAPEPPVTFVSEDVRIGDKYVLMYLVSPSRPVFSDVESADVFTTRRCGPCFITNNRGFLPMTEYDAVLVYGKRNLLSEAEAAMEPGKRYLIETTSKCIRAKFRRCMREPMITSFATKESFTLCSLCDELVTQKN